MKMITSTYKLVDFDDSYNTMHDDGIGKEGAHLGIFLILTL